MTLENGEDHGTGRPVVGAVTGWLCTRPFFVEIIAYNFNRRFQRWAGHVARAREANDEARQWSKVAPESKVQIVVKEYEHGVRHNI